MYDNSGKKKSAGYPRLVFLFVTARSYSEVRSPTGRSPNLRRRTLLNGLLCHFPQLLFIQAFRARVTQRPPFATKTRVLNDLIQRSFLHSSTQKQLLRAYLIKNWLFIPPSASSSHLASAAKAATRLACGTGRKGKQFVLSHLFPIRKRITGISL